MYRRFSGVFGRRKARSGGGPAGSGSQTIGRAFAGGLLAFGYHLGHSIVWMVPARSFGPGSVHFAFDATVRMVRVGAKVVFIG